MDELTRAEVLAPYRTQRLTRAGSAVDVWLTATTLVNEAGQLCAAATAAHASGP